MNPVDALRKPLVKAESRDERITFRITPSQRAVLEEAAREQGDELSRYVRECVFTGHSVRQAQRVLKATVGGQV